MAQNLFDHIKQITNVQNPMYWESLDDGDKKTWSNYMVHRFLSMKSEWLVVVNEIQKYWDWKVLSFTFVDKLLADSA